MERAAFEAPVPDEQLKELDRLGHRTRKARLAVFLVPTSTAA